MQNLSVHAVAHMTVVKTILRKYTHIASLGVCERLVTVHSRAIVDWALGHVNTARRNILWLLLSCGVDPDFLARHFMWEGTENEIYLNLLTGNHKEKLN